MSKKPAELVPPCGTGKKNRIDWMEGLCSHRGGRDYEFRDSELGQHSTGTWLFCWNVKLYGVDLSFDNLVRAFKRSGHGDLSEGFLKEAMAVYEGISHETLIEWGANDAARSFCGGRDYAPDDDAYSMLWDGSPVRTRFAFMGRSAGWLVMTSFEEILLTTDTDLHAESYRTIRGLSEMVWFVDRCVRGKACETVENNAAFSLFVNCCSDIEGAPG